MHICDGEFSNPPAHDMYWHIRSNCDCPAEFPAELFNPHNNPFYLEILEVAFSQNRVVFSGSRAKTLAFLQTHMQGITHIHEIEFKFEFWEIGEWARVNNDVSQLEWEELIAFVRQNFNLSNLTLSLHAGRSIPIYPDQLMYGKKGGDHRLDAYKMIIKPLRGLGDMEGGLRRFYAFWGCYYSYEAEAEKEVMGESYQAVDKIPPSRREPSDPHRDSEEFSYNTSAGVLV